MFHVGEEMIKTFFLFMLLVITALAISAQDRPAAQYRPDSCSCTQNGVCSASQTCSSGQAVCICQATGCSSHCSGGGGDPRHSGITEDEIAAVIAKKDPKALSLALSKVYGRIINFSPSDGSSQIPRPHSISASPVDWSLLEFLDKNGSLTINGHTLAFWQGMRQTLLNGGEFQICSSRADVVLNEISFISGKSFSIVAGDAKAKLDAPVQGNGLPEMLLNLSRAANVRIGVN